MSFYIAVNVTRLIRTSYGDYQLQTIPPGMAIEVPCKPIVRQKHRGPLWKPKTASSSSGTKATTTTTKQKNGDDKEEHARPVQWVRRY